MKRLLIFPILLLLFRINCLPANVVNHTGFETGDASEGAVTAGTFSIQGSTVHSGSYALRTNPTGSSTGVYRLYGMDGTGAQVVTAAVSTDCYVDFYFRYQTLGAEDFFTVFSTGSALKANMQMKNGSVIEFYDQGHTLKATGTTVLSTGTWYLLSVRIGRGGGSTAPYELKINGVSEFSGTANLLAAGTGALIFGKAQNRLSQNIDFYFDDIIWSTVTYIGAHQTAVLKPNAVGTYQQFNVIPSTDTHFGVADDTPNNGNGDYDLATSYLQKEIENLTDSCGIITGTINAVKSVHTLANGGGGTGIVQMIMRSNTTDTTFGDAGTTTVYALWGKEFQTDPATSVAWIYGGLDGVQTGTQEGDGDGFTFTRMTFTGIMVDYSPSGSNPCTSPTIPLTIFNNSQIYNGLFQ